MVESLKSDQQYIEYRESNKGESRDLKIWRIPHAIVYLDVGGLIENNARNPFINVIEFGLELTKNGIIAVPRDEGLTVCALIPDMGSLERLDNLAKEIQVPYVVGCSDNSDRFPIILSMSNSINFCSDSTVAAYRAGRAECNGGFYKIDPNGQIEGEKRTRLKAVETDEIGVYLGNEIPSDFSILLNASQAYWEIGNNRVEEETYFLKIDTNNSGELIKKNPDIGIKMSSFFTLIAEKCTSSINGENNGESLVLYCRTINEMREIIKIVLSYLSLFGVFGAFGVKIVIIAPKKRREFFFDTNKRVSFCWPPTNPSEINAAEIIAKNPERIFGTNLLKKKIPK